MEEKEHENIIALNTQEAPQKAKDVEDCLNGKLHSRKKDAKKISWNVKKRMCQKKQ